MAIRSRLCCGTVLNLSHWLEWISARSCLGVVFRGAPVRLSFLSFTLPVSLYFSQRFVTLEVLTLHCSAIFRLFNLPSKILLQKYHVPSGFITQTFSSLCLLFDCLASHISDQFLIHNMKLQGLYIYPGTI